MKELVVYQSKGKQLKFVFLALVMVAASLLVFTTGLGSQDSRNIIFIAIGLLGILFFGFCLLYIIKDFIVGKKILVVNEKGFYDYSSAIASKDFIGWERVQELGTYTIQGQVFITVFLFDGDEFIKSLPAMKRTAIKANIKLGAGHININTQAAKGISREEILHEMSIYFDEYLRKSSIVTEEISI